MDIEQLQKLLNVSSNIKWSKHCLERMQERDISIADVKSCLCLILGIRKKMKYCILLSVQITTICFL